MWDLSTFGSAPDEACRQAALLRSLVSGNEIEDSRLPNFVALSSHFNKLCLPFRDHNVDSFAPQIYEALRKRGETQIIILENPLYDDAAPQTAAVDISDKTVCRRLVDEQMFSGGFIVATGSSVFNWIGNFSDYGFLFTDSEVIEEVFGCGAFTAYCTQTCEFRLGHGGDPLLDSEVRRLDQLWSSKL